MSLFRPGFILDKFYPKFQSIEINDNKLNLLNLQSNKDVHIKVTRRTGYGDRYKLLVINKNTFKNDFKIKDYGITLINDEERITVNKIENNILAKKNGFENGDVVTDFKIENLDRPNKAVIYPFSLILLIIFGYLNYRRKPNK